MAPQIRMIGTPDNSDYSKPCYARVLYTDSAGETPESSIRYVRVMPNVLPDGWHRKLDDLKLPEFPLGDWTVAELIRDEATGNPTISNPRKMDLSALWEDAPTSRQILPNRCH